MTTRRHLLEGALASAALTACRGTDGPKASPTPGYDDGHDVIHTQMRPRDPGTDPVDGHTEGPLVDTGWDDTGVAPDACNTTDPFAEGPYFRSSAPNRTDLRVSGDGGTVFHLTLEVRSSADCLPLPGAVIELWHCNPDGDYDMTTSDLNYRCRVRTDFAGQVVLTTYKPVPYPLDDTRWMPRHFHLKVAAAGHDSLTTQLRFTGDPYDDGTLPTSLMMTPTVHSDGSESAVFVLVLDLP